MKGTESDKQETLRYLIRLKAEDHNTANLIKVAQLAMMGDDPSILEQYLTCEYLELWRQIVKNAFEK